MNRTTRWVTAVLLMIFTAGCESGPAGPGTLAVEITSPIPLGAVQVRVIGTGITAVHGLGGSEVASRLVTSTEAGDSYRIVAFAPNGGPIRIGIDVESTDATLEAVALDAAGLDGVRVGVAGVEVGVQR